MIKEILYSLMLIISFSGFVQSANCVLNDNTIEDPPES